jgi:hypothetical protein
MFDYQAGEKYKLTLIMVGVAGLIAGMFFTLLMMPTPDSNSARKARNAARMTRAMSDPDVTGRTQGQQSSSSSEGGGAANAGNEGMGSAETLVDHSKAQEFMQNWLPRVWDLSAATAGSNQEEAIRWMTPDCAAAYRLNIWSADVASKISGSSLQTEFHLKQMKVSDNLRDGSVVVTVQATQVLKAPAGTREKEINLEYMLKKTPVGMRIAGISEAKNNVQ